MLSVSVSSEQALLRRNALGYPPCLEKCLATARIACFFQREGRDPIRAEVPEPPTQFAPSDHHPGAVEEADGKGLDRAPGFGVLEIEIGDGELALKPDRSADGFEFRIAAGDRFTGADEKCASVQVVA